MKRVLVVDDDAFTSNVFRARLQREGYDVTLAATGEDAMASIERQKPHLVLLDLLLPTMSGLEVLERIRKNPETHALPVVVFTNCYRPDVEESAWKAGATNMQHKGTCPPGQMIEIVRSALAAAEETPASAAPTEETALSATAINAQFKAQVGGWLDQLRSAALQMTSNNASGVTRGLASMQLVLQRITGGAAVAGRPALARLSSALDAFCAFLGEATMPMNPAQLETLDTALDAVEAQLTSSPPSASPSALPLSSPVGLVVDPDHASRRLVRTALERFGFTVITVPDPAHARALCADNSFSLMVMDAASGLELYKNLNALSAPASAPVLFTTTLDREQPAVQEILKAGHGVISKPYPPVELGLRACMALPR